MKIDDIHDLYLFARVVEAGGFAAAERDTAIPKSRLSRRIAALEKPLGVRLIQRSAHAFSVTDVGQSVYRHARTIADEAQATLSTVAETLNEPSGLVRISASTLTAELYLAGWLGEFTATYPKVRIALDLSNRFVDLLSEGVDLAIRFSTGPLVSADLVARQLGVSRMVLVASPALLAKHGAPAELADLARLPALGQGTLESTRPWSFKAADDSVVTPSTAQAGHGKHHRTARGGDSWGGHHSTAVGCLSCRGRTRRIAAAARAVSIHWHRHLLCLPSRVGMPAAVRMLLSFLAERFRATS